MALMEKGAVKVMMPTLGFNVESSKFLNNKHAGFTLLEILLVISIIGLVSILVLPSIGDIEFRTFNSQVREAASLLRFAKRTAVVQGSPASIEIYAVPSSELETLPSPTSVGYWEFSYGDLIFEESTEVTYEVEEKIEIVFYPEGGSTGGVISLIFEERKSKIRIDPFSGRVKIENES